MHRPIRYLKAHGGLTCKALVKIRRLRHSLRLHMHPSYRSIVTALLLKFCLHLGHIVSDNIGLVMVRWWAQPGFLIDYCMRHAARASRPISPLNISLLFDSQVLRALPAGSYSFCFLCYPSSTPCCSWLHRDSSNPSLRSSRAASGDWSSPVRHKVQWIVVVFRFGWERSSLLGNLVTYS